MSLPSTPEGLGEDFGEGETGTIKGIADGGSRSAAIPPAHSRAWCLSIDDNKLIPYDDRQECLPFSPHHIVEFAAC